MAQRAVEQMGVEAFLLWAEAQEERFELVDGVPQMMAGARRRHDRIVTNLVSSWAVQLRGQRCEAFTADTAVVTGSGNVRLPDVGIDCGADDEERRARDPVVVVEVLSPATRDSDLNGKLAEYKALASIQYIVIIDPEQAFVTVGSRDGGGAWSSEEIVGIDRTLHLPVLALSVRLTALYDRVGLPPRPRLIT